MPPEGPAPITRTSATESPAPLGFWLVDCMGFSAGGSSDLLHDGADLDTALRADSGERGAGVADGLAEGVHGALESADVAPAEEEAHHGVNAVPLRAGGAEVPGTDRVVDADERLRRQVGHPQDAARGALDECTEVHRVPADQGAVDVAVVVDRAGQLVPVTAGVLDVGDVRAAL